MMQILTALGSLLCACLKINNLTVFSMEQSQGENRSPQRLVYLLTTDFHLHHCLRDPPNLSGKLDHLSVSMAQTQGSLDLKYPPKQRQRHAGV